MERESVIRTASEWSIQADMLAAAVTSLQTKGKTGCYIYAAAGAFLFDIFNSSPFFSPTCNTVFLTGV